MSIDVIFDDSTTIFKINSFYNCVGHDHGNSDKNQLKLNIKIKTEIVGKAWVECVETYLKVCSPGKKKDILIMSDYHNQLPLFFLYGSTELLFYFLFLFWL